MIDKEKKKQMAIEAVRLCNVFIGDLIIGIRSSEDAMLTKIGFRRDTNIGSYKRMCYSHVIVTLSKWTELYDRYKSIIPSSCKDACLNLKKEIERRGIKDFRNKYVGHIWDNDSGRPLALEELLQHMKATGLDKEDEFRKWINNPANNQFPNTVISIVERARDMMMKEYGLSEETLFPGIDSLK